MREHPSEMLPTNPFSPENPRLPASGLRLPYTCVNIGRKREERVNSWGWLV